MRNSHRSLAGRALPLVLACILLSAVLVPMVAQAAAPAALPPPPPPPPGPARKPGPDGAWLELQAQFPAGWPWAEVGWQEVWTAVQWQDPHTGVWRDVEGWRGGLDSVATDEADAVVGKKGWWVAGKDFGTGPFRWQVTRSEGGKLLGTSEPFELPGSTRASVVVEVALMP